MRLEPNGADFFVAAYEHWLMCGAMAGGGEPGTSLTRSVQSELSAHAAERLPEYMVPSSFTIMRDIPLTVSGKVDRERLPEPDDTSSQCASGAASKQRFIAARTVLEAQIADAIRMVLQLEHADLDASIEALGHMPLPDQLMIARLKRKKLTLRDEIAKVEDRILPDIIA
jgi:hypothetical protein